MVNAHILIKYSFIVCLFILSLLLGFNPNVCASTYAYPPTSLIGLLRAGSSRYGVGGVTSPSRAAEDKDTTKSHN